MPFTPKVTHFLPPFYNLESGELLTYNANPNHGILIQTFFFFFFKKEKPQVRLFLTFYTTHTPKKKKTLKLYFAKMIAIINIE
jgi:hypothetical protein